MNRIISETENRLLNLISIVIEPLKTITGRGHE